MIHCSHTCGVSTVAVVSCYYENSLQNTEGSKFLRNYRITQRAFLWAVIGHTRKHTYTHTDRQT